MPMKAICPYCQKVGVIPESFSGKDIKCPQCKSVFKVCLPPPPDPMVVATSEKPTKPGASRIILNDASQRRAKSNAAPETITKIQFQTHGGCAAIFIEVVATIFTAGFLGGMGSLVAGRGPASLASSILFSILFAIGTFLTVGLLLPVWILFVVIKLIFDIIRSA